jgi:quercetin dioxygenase-like cupin family protein
MEKEVRVVELNKAREYQRLIDGTDQSFGLKAGRVFLESGQACGQHSTHDREEILVIHSGKGLLKTGESDEHRIAAGNIAYVPPQTQHDVQNDGSEPLIYVFCVVPVAM